MRKLLERLALFFIGLPLIVASVFFLPQHNYLVLHIEILAFSVLAILEMRSMVSKKLTVHSIPVSLFIGLFIPVASFLYAVLDVRFRFITYSIAISCVVILAIEFIFSFSGKFEKSIERIASTFILVIYPGYFIMYLSIMTVWKEAGAVLSLFFLMVFGCDSLAWFFGMLFGKNNRGFVPASPNKSIMGFLGGYLGSIIPGVAAYFLLPNIFTGSILKMILLGTLTATAAIIGDIIESIFKRSAGIKDSGNIIPGRGGVLDSIDSILLAAPVYYILCDFLFAFKGQMNSRKKIIILGATGSIGSSTIDIVRNFPDRFEVAGLSAHRDRTGLTSLAREFGIGNPVLSEESGPDSILDMIRETDADIVVNGIAGSSGLLPSQAALESGKDLALANKETIVMAGLLIRSLASSAGKKILPVDSEHSAVFDLIEAYGKETISEIVLTASGGPFRTWETGKLITVKPSDALKHPTWSMGAKITIDSASLANKGLEVIEACRLFDIEPDRVKVVVHPQSLVHSFIRTTDGVLYAQISPPDMRHPILSALSWPSSAPNYLEALSFEKLCTMQFEPPRYRDFPLLGLAYRAASLSGRYTIAYNAANEEAVSAFLAGHISFPALAEVTAAVLDADWTGEPSTFEEVLEADRIARIAAKKAIKEKAV